MIENITDRTHKLVGPVRTGNGTKAAKKKKEKASESPHMEALPSAVHA